MPNWCYQQFSVYGKPEDLRAFAAASRSGDQFGLNHLFPIPEKLANTTSGWSSDEVIQAEYERKYAENMAEFGYKDWYDWAYDNWSTKWGACDFEWRSHDFERDISILDSETSLDGYFESAWGPASNLVKKISGDFPNLVFEVFRGGALVVQDGEEPEMPKSIDEAFEKNNDDAFEQLSDWQNDLEYKYAERCEDSVSKVLAEAS
jgi:hypothetical protein